MENFEQITDRILDTTIEDVIHNSMIPYAEYVILDRAIPRVEDGLKPVQRRILYSMYELGITPDKPTRKSARIVGDCLGKFHPHGDTSVYGALVRMGQPFSIRNCLVDGQGNFGSVDGDSAAAMRYTEARLAPLAMELLRDIDKNTVEFTNNFDDTLVEPVTLPGRFPNLLVNGASGIAVGLATNIPTHNLAEVIDGTIAMIKKPDISLLELMKYIPAPDFPTGAYIIKTDLEKAYETGRGKIFIRAKVNIEKEKDKETIVITELPYQVNKAIVQQKIIALRELQKDNKQSILLGINEVVDESDMNGTRVVIRIKKDYSAREIISELFRKTDLEVSFNINMVAIASGKPQTMSLVSILTAYIKYQMSVILRRAKYDYEDAKKREHILDGLLIAVHNIDEVIQIIKTSKNTPEAKIKLIERFLLSGEQAQAILDMRLAKINTLEVYKLEQEIAELKKLIEELYAIIHSDEKRKNVLITELLEIKKKYGDERRSIIVESEDDIVIRHQDDNVIEPCVIQLLATGELKRISNDMLKKVTKATNFKNDLTSIALQSVETFTDKTILAFTDLGNCYQFRADTIELSKLAQKNLPRAGILNSLQDDEKIIKIFVSEDEVNSLIFFTEQGLIKKTSFGEYKMTKESFLGIKLKEDDKLINVETFDEKKQLFFATREGMCLRCEVSDVPEQGRVSMGVKGINLSDDDKVVSATQVSDSGEIYVVSTIGLAKKVIISHIPVTARYRKGVKLIDFKNKEIEKVVGAGYVKTPKLIAIVGDTNDINAIYTEEISIEKRETKGKLINDVKFFEKILNIFELN